MKYTIEGFSQEYAITLKDEKSRIDCTDLAILRWFVDFQATGKMDFVDVGRDRFFWVNYNSLLDDMPILSLSKRSLYDRLQKMVKFGLLKHYHKKSGGSFSFYCFGDSFFDLAFSKCEENPKEQRSKLQTPMKQTSDPYEENFGQGMNFTSYPLGSELPNKYPSTNDPSTNDPSSKNNFARKRFTPPSVDEVREYCNEINATISPDAFVDYYAAQGWIYGKSGKQMKDWKAAVRNWQRREKTTTGNVFLEIAREEGLI